MGLCWREETQKPRDVIQTAHTFWKCKHFHILRINKVTYKTSLYSCVYVQLPCLTQYFLGYSIAPSPKKNMLKKLWPLCQPLREWIVPNISPFPKSWSCKWMICFVFNTCFYQKWMISGRTKIISRKFKGFFSLTYEDVWEKNQDFFKQHVPWSSLPGTWNMKYLFTYSTHSWPTLAISWIDTRRSHLGELSNYRWNKPKAAQRLLSWYKTNEFLITGNKESGRPTVWNYKSTIFISTYLLIASKTWWYLKIDIYIYHIYWLQYIYLWIYLQ